MTITLYYEQLEHTIVQILHRAGAKLEDLDLRSNAQMDEGRSDQQLIRRLIRTGVAKVKLLLREHLETSADAEATAADDKLREEEESWVFALDMTGDGQSLADLLHWFVVWMALRGVASALGLGDMLEEAAGNEKEAEDLIKDELMQLSMPTKRHRTIVKPEDYSPKIELSNND